MGLIKKYKIKTLIHRASQEYKIKTLIHMHLYFALQPFQLLTPDHTFLFKHPPSAKDLASLSELTLPDIRSYIAYGASPWGYALYMP